MKKHLAIALLASAACASTASAHTLYSRDPDGVNIRKGPGTSYPILRSLGPAEGAAVLGRELDWYKVRLADGTVGYAAAWVSRVLFEDEEQMAVVDTDVLNVRSGPDLQAAVLGTVQQGERLRLREIRGDWWRVDFRGGTGWVFGAYMRQEEPPPVQPPAGSPAPPPEGSPATPPGGAPASPGTPSGPPSQPPDSPAAPPPARRLTGKGVALAVPQADVLLGRHPRYDTVDTVKAEEPLTYLDAAEGWVQVQTPRGIRGWLPGTQVALWDGDVEWARGAYYRLAEGLWQFSFLPVRTVTPAEGLRLRQGPDTGAPVLATLAKGTLLKVVQDRGNWLQVSAADGRFGWVAAEFTAPAGGPGRRLQSATLRSVAPGVLQLELTGQLEGAAVRDGADGRSLLIHLPDWSGPRASLKVADAGITELAVDTLGVSLGFSERPHVQVVEQSPGRIRVELRPAVTEMALRLENGNAIYRIGVQGAVWPATAVNGADVVVALPGARLLADRLPPYVTAEQKDGSLRLRVPSRRQFALKRVEGGFDLVFYPAGLSGKVILVDPGHGGEEPGAVAASGLKEKDVNLAVALKLREQLEARGARVLMTRTADTGALPKDRPVNGDRLRADLDWRTRLANEQKVDLFISIHSNSGPAGMAGTETFYSSANLNADRSRALADAVQAELLQALGRRDRRVQEALFYVIRYTEAPAVLAELAFLSDPEEAKLLASDAFRLKAAQAIARAVGRHYEERK